MKTPEELASVYAYNNFGNTQSYDAAEIESAAKDGFIAGFTEATRWRSVEEGLPKDAGRYMVKYNNDFIEIANIRFFNEDMNKPYFEHYSQIGNITHWRPIY